jgi:hypothetical protein
MLSRRDGEEMLLGWKRVFALLTLVAIAVTTMVWSQAMVITPGVAVSESRVWRIDLPDIVVEPNIMRTFARDNALNVSLYFTYTVIRVSLIDLGGLYEAMEQFTVVFKNDTHVFALLTPTQPVADLVYTTSRKVEKEFIDVDVIISYKVKSIVPAEISYTVYGEVVGTLGTPLT